MCNWPNMTRLCVVYCGTSFLLVFGDVTYRQVCLIWVYPKYNQSEHQPLATSQAESQATLVAGLSRAETCQLTRLQPSLASLWEGFVWSGSFRLNYDLKFASGTNWRTWRKKTKKKNETSFCRIKKSTFVVTNKIEVLKPTPLSVVCKSSITNGQSPWVSIFRWITLFVHMLYIGWVDL